MTQVGTPTNSLKQTPNRGRYIENGVNVSRVQITKEVRTIGESPRKRFGQLSSVR